MERRRVVITGLGCISPVGNSVEEAWKNICNGVSGISAITAFDPKNIDCKIAGQVKNFDATTFGIEKKSLRKMARFTQFLLAASIQAVNDSGFTRENISNEKIAVISGNCLGGLDALDEGYKKFLDPEFGVQRIPTFTTPLMISNEAAANVSIYFGIKNKCWTINTACASGTDAIGIATDMIRSGRIDMCISGGTESTITEFAIGSYGQLQALSTKFNDSPEKASRPFDRDRCGFVASEGACVLVLEELDHALKRGARIYAEISGYGSSSDANHITTPLADGSGAGLALREAIDDAGISPDKLEYYNAHGTSTSINDLSETRMLKSVLGDYSDRINISSTKSMTGHLIGAAGAFEAMFCALALRDGFIPPTINLDNPDIEGGCDLNYTPNTGIKKKIKYAASASLGFGGHNSCIILTKI